MAQRKITMRALCCGPNGTLHTGKHYVVEAEFAQQLVDGGFAEYMEKAAAPEPAPAKGRRGKRETATVSPPERADQDAGSPKGGE